MASGHYTIIYPDKRRVTSGGNTTHIKKMYHIAKAHKFPKGTEIRFYWGNPEKKLRRILNF